MEGKRIFGVVIMTVLVCIALTPSVAAKDGGLGLPEEYYDMMEDLPEDVVERLPEGLYSEDGDTVGEAITELVDTEKILDFLGELVGEGTYNTLGISARLCGILVIAAIFSALRESVRSEAIGSALRFCSSCAVFALLSGLIYKQISMVQSYFERINSVMLAMIPVTGAVWAMGGNVSTAASGSGTLYAFMAVSENICAASIVPVSCISVALALCRCLSPSMNLQGIASGIKKGYTFVLGFIMTLLLTLLSSQTAIGTAADTAAARAAKMVASSAIPIVGGSVSDTLRSVAAGVQYMKSVVGVSGIAVILILVLPTLISLLLTRLALIMSGCVADLLGCENESRLIGDLGGVWSCMIAVVAMTAVMFILIMNIFIKTTVAAM